MLARRVTGAAFVGLEAGDRAKVDDVAVLGLAQKRQARSRHAHQAENIDLPHLDPVCVAGLIDRVEPQGQARVVDQHVDASELFGHFADERIDARRVGHIEGQSHSQVANDTAHTRQPASPGDDLVAAPPQRHDSGGADA